jgi:glucose-6-phosphate 1-dehydrogenase
MSRQAPIILVIFGITGDLARRKLLPAIEQLARAGVMASQLRIIGTTRRAVSADEIIAQVKGVDQDFLRQNLQMCQLDPLQLDDYRQLGQCLDAIESEWGQPAQRLFYLSVPPQVSRPIIALLGQAGLQHAPHTKLLLEKPFGTDYHSAEALIDQTRQYFTEDQIYRIDHYLAKEMAQNLIIFRSRNALFRRTWDNRFIDHITITASEEIGIEGRANFYEQTGALRDLVQSHLLQLAALVLMQPPAQDDLSDVPTQRLAALRSLAIPSDQPLTHYVKRAQYNGYRDEVDNQRSTVETYVSLTLASNDTQWQGVPITLVTGKGLPKKTTKICISYKNEDEHAADELTIRLQPDEGIDLCLWTKKPGYVQEVERRSLYFSFKDAYDMLPEAYEQVILEAIKGNHTLFTSSDEVLETWRILAPVQAAWSMSSADLQSYQVGHVPAQTS